MRGFLSCGTGANWTLTADVCLDCNGLFSKFEAHWFRQVIEAMARNFSGPVSRNEKERFDRPQPMEIDDLYIVNRDDPLVYEAGFSFPNDPHYRPQIIDTPEGLLWIAANASDGSAFHSAVEDMVRQGHFEITVPMWKKRHHEWLIAAVELSRINRGSRIGEWYRRNKPAGLWLRSYPRGNLLLREGLPNTQLTTRLALDHRRRLYIRSANIETAVAFFDRFSQPQATVKPNPHHGPGNQTVVIGIKIDRSRVYRAVIKTGFNLFCHFVGAAVARHPCFQSLRDILLIEDVGKKNAVRVCRMDDGAPPDFPKAGTVGEHRMQLDVTAEGYLRFRLRLFDSIGYSAHLGIVPSDLRNLLVTRRVVVSYLAEGIREVDTW